MRENLRKSYELHACLARVQSQLNNTDYDNSYNLNLNYLNEKNRTRKFEKIIRTTRLSRACTITIE